MRKLSALFVLSGAAVALVACGSSDGPAGPPGPPGAQGPAGTSGSGPTGGAVFPNTGFLGREVDVVITGDGASFDATTTVAMGPGVTVSNIQVVNADTIYAHLSIDKSATIGPQDVVITQGQTTLTGKGGFKVNATMDAKITGDQLQGGVVDITLTDNDTANAFDPNSFALDTPGSLLALGGQGVSGNSADFLYAIDPLATVTAAAQLEGDNTDATTGNTLPFYTAPGAFAIGARTATALTLGTALTTDTFNGVFSSHLYKVTAPAGKTGEFAIEISTGAADATLPAALLYPSSGIGADLLNIQVAQNPNSVYLPIGTILDNAAATADFYLTVTDQDGTAGNKISIKPSFFDMGGAAYAEVGTGASAHATSATVEDITAACVTAGVLKPSCVVKGSISTATETDLYQFTVAASTKLEMVLLGTGPFDAGPVDPSLITVTSTPPDLSGPDIFGDQTGIEDVYTGTGTLAVSSGVTTKKLTTWIIGVAAQQGAADAAGAYTLSIRATN